MTPTKQTTGPLYDLHLHTEDQLRALIDHATGILRHRDAYAAASVRAARRLLAEANTELLGRGVR